MYARPTDRVDDEAEAIQFLETAAFMHLISASEDGLSASSVPMIVDQRTGRLIGHVARANEHWRHLDGRRALVIAAPSDGYVSPSWYPSKHENDGRVVPTWNYESVHVHGIARVHHDAEWLLDVVNRLTETHEARRTDGADRWSISDAPADFIDQQLRAIVGVSVTMERVDAKRKLTGNRSTADRAGVRDGLARTRDVSARLVRSMTAAAGPANSP